MTSLLGLVLGILCVVGGAISDSDPLSSLFSVTAVIIVLCGAFSASLVHFGLGPMITAMKGLGWLAKPPKTDLPKFIEQVAEWSTLARSQGTLALENIIPTVADPFQRQGLQMIVDNTGPDDFATILEIMGENAGRTQMAPAEVWEALGGYSPTIGVMGAVLGLIHVMMRLDHPEELGQGIATAFVATIYGVGFANLIALPLGARFKHLAKELERERHVVIQGFMLLAEGKPGIVIRQNLQSFLETKKSPVKPETGDEPAGAAQPAE
ncbi:flagellar motor protein [Acidocella sp.]|uniref:flagellar motor protein n=1 Tax=Acidocella sp. TaxID=50710 RepID=UPI00260AE8EF|nr:flagellar motor protein [Acidocella sp.]